MEEKFYSQKEPEYEYSYNIDPEEEKRKRLEEQKENQNIMRKMKKKYTFSQIDIAKKFRRIDGDKIITNEARNMDKKTKEILNNPKEKINKVNLNLKFKKLEVKQKLLNDRLNLNKEEENKKFPNDIVYKLVMDEPVFESKLKYNKLLSLKEKEKEKEIIKHNDSFSEEEEESIYNNFCLSAYNIKNNKILKQYSKKYDSDVKILRHISSYTKFNDKKKLIDRNQNFDDYRYNYLDLRKTIGEFKKYEYEEIMNRLSKKKDIREDEKKNTGFKLRYNYSQKENNIRYMRQKVLSSALMNPNEESTFPRYFLPRTGTTLISKNEPPVAGKKKRRRR